tara:strand:+ start:2655 stop:2810 length:156 start_codon:yes stop_codon:yes gene_type:complete
MSRIWIPKFFEKLFELTTPIKNKKRIYSVRGKKYVIKDYVGRKPKNRKLYN